MDPKDIEAKIRAALPDAVIHLEDLTGTRDHWRAVITSASFAGLMPLARHRLVMSALKEEMKGAIHALTMDLRTPTE